MTTTLYIENMKCGGCSAKIESVLAQLSSVEFYNVNLDEKTVNVEGDVDVQAIAKAITDAGYPTILL